MIILPLGRGILKDGLSCQEGTSILAAFTNIDDLISYLYAHYTSMFINLESQFEVLPVSFVFKSTVPHVEKQMANYFVDQIKKNKNIQETTDTSDNLASDRKRFKNEYMKQYMKKRRMDPTFRNNERHNELCSKQNARKDPDFRNAERESEVASKQNVRKNTDFKQKEQVAKQSARKDESFRNTERQYELASKQNARKDTDFKQKERVAKQSARQDESFRNSERQKELASKQKARKDPDFKKDEFKRDLKRKQKSRSIPLNLEKERLHKQNLRRKNPEKEKAYNKNKKQLKRKSSIFLENEQLLKKRKVQGSTIEECIKKFEEKISEGPLYICICCHQTWFSDSVVNACSFKKTTTTSIRRYLTELKSVEDREWICHTCMKALKHDKIPRLSLANRMGFPEKPKELDLYPLEERLISLRIPFMQIRQLPRGGQFSIKGNVVNVPVDVQPTIDALPRTLDQSGTISVKLKKKLTYKSCDFRENIRPSAVICALHYLMNKSELYKSSGVQIDENWLQEINHLLAECSNTLSEQENNNEEEESDNDEIADTFNEIKDTDLHAENMDTLLDEIEDEGNPKYDTEYVFAPGEGHRPLALYRDPDAEYLSFPTIFVWRETCRQ